MKSEKSGRAAPIFALLVIILGLVIVFWGIPNLPNFDAFLIAPTQIPVVSEATDDAVIATDTLSPVLPSATFVPINLEDEYESHRIRGEMQAALYHIEAQALSNAWTTQDYIRAGNLWRDMGDFSRALPYWEAANALEPNPNLLRQIAEIYIQRGEWGIAWARIQQLLELAPNDAWALYYGGLILAPSDPTRAYGLFGRVADIERNYAVTAFDIQALIGGDPTDPEIAVRVASLLAGVTEWSLAENAYQYAADTFYPFPEATAYVALMRVQQGKNGERWIEEALTLSQDNAVVHYIAGVYWRAVGEYARSESNLILAILFEPNNPTFYAELGITYAEMGNSFEAEVWLQTAVLISDDPVIAEALEGFYQDEAYLAPQGYLEFSRGIETDDPAILSAKGWTLHVQGDSEAGLAQVETALSVDPDNPRALFDKARILIDIAQIDEAIPLLTQLAEGDSVFSEPARRLLESFN
jgi:tetratricopeptide (TPR) repeat protein